MKNTFNFNLENVRFKVSGEEVIVGKVSIVTEVDMEPQSYVKTIEFVQNVMNQLIKLNERAMK